MIRIDWSKSPDGAQAYMTESSKWLPGWWKRQGTQSYFCATSSSKWQAVVGKPWGHPCMIMRPDETPAQWGGSQTGLPPVGVVCEYSFGGGPWFECEIRHVLDNDQDFDADGWAAVVWCPHLRKEQYAHVGRESRWLFRPIETHEQKAAREREEAITDIALIIGKDTANNAIRERAAVIYDAGYRKQPEDK